MEIGIRSVGREESEGRCEGCEGCEGCVGWEGCEGCEGCEGVEASGTERVEGEGSGESNVVE